MSVVLKSKSLNLLEPSGPVQACNGTAFQVLVVLLCIVLFGRVPWRPTVREEHRLNMFEKNVAELNVWVQEEGSNYA